MKKVFITGAVLAVLATMTASCQKGYYHYLNYNISSSYPGHAVETLVID